MPEQIIGWDLGGAHLKAATVSPDGELCQVEQCACPLWEGLDKFHTAVHATLERLPERPALHAVTMTGELVDLFNNREQGVRTLIDSMKEHASPVDIQVYGGQLGFLDTEQAIRNIDRVASANWLASVTFTATKVYQGLFVDVGSTTTDIIPFNQGHIIARGYKDYDRLRKDELIYTGVVRTPVMTLAHRVPFEGTWIKLMTELFATTADVYRLTKALPVHADMLPSADRGGKSEIDSARRLARMLGRDVETAPISDWKRVASYLAERQLNVIADACACNLSLGIVSDDSPFVGAGVGRFLVRKLASRLGYPYKDFGDFFPDHARARHRLDIADCAPAVAVASLAHLHLQKARPATQRLI